MIKRIFILILTLSLLFAACLSVSAYKWTDNVYDNEDQLASYQANSLDSYLKRISEDNDCLVAVATDTYCYGSAESYAKNIYKTYFDDSDYENGGILLFVSMNERNYGIYCEGKAYDKIFKSSVLDEIEDAIIPYLSEGDVYSALNAFANKCEEALAKYTSVSVNPLWIPIALGIGIVIAFIVVLIMKSQLKSVHFQSAAEDYVKSGSFHLTESRDIFLYSTITRTPKPQPKSSGGGRSGSF